MHAFILEGIRPSYSLFLAQCLEMDFVKILTTLCWLACSINLSSNIYLCVCLFATESKGGCPQKSKTKKIIQIHLSILYKTSIPVVFRYCYKWWWCMHIFVISPQIDEGYNDPDRLGKRILTFPPLFATWRIVATFDLLWSADERCAYSYKGHLPMRLIVL